MLVKAQRRDLKLGNSPAIDLSWLATTSFTPELIRLRNLKEHFKAERQVEKRDKNILGMHTAECLKYMLSKPVTVRGLTVPGNTKLALGVCHPYDAASHMSLFVYDFYIF